MTPYTCRQCHPWRGAAVEFDTMEEAMKHVVEAHPGRTAYLLETLAKNSQQWLLRHRSEDGAQ